MFANYVKFMLGISAVSLVGYYLFRPVELPPNFDPSDPIQTGCREQLNVVGVVFAGTDDRLRAGLSLYAKGAVKFLLISGFEVTEDASQLWKRLRIKGGRDLDGIVIDRNAVNTYETALIVGKFADITNASRIVVITSAYHAPRAGGYMKENTRLPVNLFSVRDTPGSARELSEVAKIAAWRLGFPYIEHKQIGVPSAFSYVPTTIAQQLSQPQASITLEIDSSDQSFCSRPHQDISPSARRLLSAPARSIN